MPELCLTILCPPALEERVLDTLLMSPDITLFTSAPAAAHGLAHARLDATEQVLGMARMTLVQALLTHADREAVLAGLHQQFAGTGLHYWLTPVIEAGEFA